MGQKFLLILKKETGAVLVISLLIMLMLTVLGIAAIRTVTTDINIAANDRSAKQAFTLAEAGVERALAEINNNTIDPPDDVDGSSVTLSDSSHSTGSYNVSITRIAADMLQITSTGTTTNGKGTKTIVVNVRESVFYPEIYNFALFSRESISLRGSVEVYNGDIYSGRNIFIRASDVVQDGDVLAAEHVVFGGSGNIVNGSVFANGNIDLSNQQNQTRIDGGDATAGGAISGSGIVTGSINPGTSPDPVQRVSYYEADYKVTQAQFNEYFDQADTYLVGDQTITGGYYEGIIYVQGNLDIHGDFTGDATFVVTGDLRISGNVDNTGNDSYAFIIDGDVWSSGMGNSDIDGVIYCNGNFDSQGNTSVNGSVVSFGDEGITGTGQVNIHYVPPTSQDLYGPPQYSYSIVSWQG